MPNQEGLAFRSPRNFRGQTLSGEAALKEHPPSVRALKSNGRSSQIALEILSFEGCFEALAEKYAAARGELSARGVELS